MTNHDEELEELLKSFQDDPKRQTYMSLLAEQ